MVFVGVVGFLGCLLDFEGLVGQVCSKLLILLLYGDQDFVVFFDSMVIVGKVLKVVGFDVVIYVMCGMLYGIFLDGFSMVLVFLK